jgi:hypothetical protein
MPVTVFGETAYFGTRVLRLRYTRAADELLETLMNMRPDEVASGVLKRRGCGGRCMACIGRCPGAPHVRPYIDGEP